jgi:pyrimidine-nucleoside phosphorylase
MHPAWLIQKKRDGKELSADEIRDFVDGLSDGRVADYQATAFLMATFFKGMTLDETVALTQAMLHSGEVYDLSNIPGLKIDKHSTGGVGDKVSIILAPLAAACGLKNPMMAGRGLGHSGGTIDKLEAIPGFRTQLPRAEFDRQLLDVGCAIIGQSDKIAPADKKLYALRDVTATIECVPLIVGSILSKKIAAGVNGLVMDVKVGNGAFMKTPKQAMNLAQQLVKVGKKLGLKIRALVTNMSQPLGYAAGNSIEILECIQILKNETVRDLGSGDLKELTVLLCAHMLELGGKAKSLAEGRKLAHKKLADGSAWAKFQAMVQAQGGSLEAILHPEKGLPLAPKALVFAARKRGYVTEMDTEALGRLLVDLGGGRRQVTDSVDFGASLVFHNKLGAKVSAGDPLVTVYGAPEKVAAANVAQRLHDAITVTGTRKPVPKLVFGQY